MIIETNCRNGRNVMTIKLTVTASEFSLIRRLITRQAEANENSAYPETADPYDELCIKLVGQKVRQISKKIRRI